jgi:transcription antitermination factor NusG
MIGDYEFGKMKIGHYLPLTKISFERMRRMVIASRALFPGIVFVHFPDEEAEAKGFEKLRGWPGFINMLRSGNPRTGPWGEIEAIGIRTLMEQELQLSTASKKLKMPYAVGDRVQLTGTNPFAGFRAMIEEVAPNERITMLLDVFGRKTRMTVDPGEVIKV